MLIKIKVKTGSKQRKVEQTGENAYSVSVKAKPKNNEANSEVISLLENKLNRKARIVKGFKYKNKVIDLV